MEGGQEGRRDADTEDRYRKDENTRDRGLGGKELTDRKSTRLNSSHL